MTFTQSERRLFHTCIMCETKIFPGQRETRVTPHFRTANPTFHHTDMEDCQKGLRNDAIYPSPYASSGKVSC